MLIVNEGSGREYAAYFESTPGVPTVPVTAHWRLVMVQNNKTQILQDWTEATPIVETDPITGAITGVRIEINIDGALNTMVDSTLRREGRELQVVASKGSPREYSKTEPYFVQPMSGGR